MMDAAQIQVAVAWADLWLYTWGAPVALGIVAVLAVCIALVWVMGQK